MASVVDGDNGCDGCHMNDGTMGMGMGMGMEMGTEMGMGDRDGDGHA